MAGLLPQPARDQVLREAWDQVIARNEDPEDGFDELLTLWQAAPGTTLAAEALLATAYAIEDPDARANALGSLAEDDTALSVAQRAVVAGDAWAAVAEIDDLPERKDALVRLADAVPESLLGDAVRALLEAAGNAGHGGYYTAADVLAAALRCAARVPSFPDGLLRDARDRAAALTKPVSKATALAAIAQAAPGLEQDALMAEASQAICEMPIDARPHALARLLAYAPDACKDDVFRSLQEAARTLEPAPARAKALREVAVLILEPDPVQRALLREAHEITPVVQGNPEPDDAEFVLASAMLAARLPPEQQMDLVTDMLPVARQIDDPHDRARALAALIAFLPVAGQREVAAEVLDAADQVDEPEWAAEDLAAIIPYLEGTQRDRVLTEAAECVRAIPTDVVSRLKSAILDASEGIIGDVDFHFSGPRVRAQQAARLSALAPPGELKEQLMREAVDAVYASVYSQADTVIAVSPYLSEAAVRQLLAAIRAVPQEPFRAQVMAALLARLAELESPPSAHSQATTIWGSAIPEVVLAALESPEANEAHNPPDEPSTAVDEAAQMASPRSFDVTVEFIARTEDWLSDLFTLVGGDPPIVASMTAAPAGIDEEGRKDIERQFLDAFIAHTCAELPLDEVARVLRRAVEFTHDPQWTRAKAALISRLVGLGCTPAALEEARIAWPAIPPAQGFAAIASLLEPSARRQLTAQILAVTGQIEDPMERADALCAITRHLPASSLGPALEYIEQVIGDQLANIRRPNDITPELARLLSAIPPGRRLPAWQQVLRAASRGSRRQLLMHLPALMAAAEGLHTGQLYEDVSKYLLEVRKAPRL